MSEKIFLLRKAIDNIMNDVLQKAFNYSVNHPQDSDQLNKLIKNVREDNDRFVNNLHAISKADNLEAEETKSQLRALTKELKNKSLIYLSEIQKLQEREQNT